MPDAGSDADTEKVAKLLGGPKILRATPRTPLEAHELLLTGLPGKAVGYLFDRLRVLRRDNSFERAIGMTLRTVQRRKVGPAKPLTQEQSARMWTFAETLARATAIFGSQDEAERWLERPAIGLDRRRPLDLLATPAGAAIVETYLTRVEHGVYT